MSATRPIVGGSVAAANAEDGGAVFSLQLAEKPD
jgi:hypothetical protein